MWYQSCTPRDVIFCVMWNWRPLIISGATQSLVTCYIHAPNSSKFIRALKYHFDIKHVLYANLLLPFVNLNDKETRLRLFLERMPKEVHLVVEVLFEAMVSDRLWDHRLKLLLLCVRSRLKGFPRWCIPNDRDVQYLSFRFKQKWLLSKTWILSARETKSKAILAIFLNFLLGM